MHTPTPLYSSSATSPWHAGEKQLQAKVGVADRMETVGNKVIRDYLPEQHREFYRHLPFLLLGAVDAEGRRCWQAGEPRRIQRLNRAHRLGYFYRKGTLYA
jgi:predicted pyridoxine 5'-phosphate oxidase superfamily flavin-nucleotide-binding protein